MKKSYYTYFVQAKNGFVGFNTISNSLVYLHKDVYENYYQTGEYQKMCDLYPVQYEKMINNGFFIADDVDEFENLRREYENHANTSEIYELTLLPSLDCNLRCWYCFEKHIVGSHLSISVQNSILSHIKQKMNDPDLKILRVTMFGGEPLMYFKEELFPLLKQIKQIVESANKQVTFFFVTNALCIDDASIPLFEELNSNFQISIDGYKEKHDKVKHIPGSSDSSYDQVIEIIHKLTKRLDNVFINLRINYDDRTLSHIDQLVEDIISVDRNKIAIHLERVWQTLERRESNNLQLKNAIKLLLVNNFSVSYMNLFRKHVSCNTSMGNQCVISYDGKVYKCTGRDFTDDFSEGILQEDGYILWNTEKLNKRMQICTYDNEKCRACKFLPLCWGPCNQKILESGVSEESISRLCQLNLLEIPLEDYVIFRFNNEFVVQRNREKNDVSE